MDNEHKTLPEKRPVFFGVRICLLCCGKIIEGGAKMNLARILEWVFPIIAAVLSVVTAVIGERLIHGKIPESVLEKFASTKFVKAVEKLSSHGRGAGTTR